MRFVSLSGKSQNAKAIVDDSDLELVAGHKWYFHDGYAAATIKKKTVYMHRLVAKTPIGMHTDHLNHNKLDNRSQNLRICSHAQNMQNIVKNPRSRGCVRKRFINKKHYYFGEVQVDLKRYSTVPCDNEEQARGALKEMIRDKKL